MERPIAPVKVPDPPTPWRAQRFANAMLMIFVFFPLALVFEEIGRPFRLHFCPPATFLSGTLQPAWEICFMFAAMSLTWFIRYWFLVWAPPLQDTFGFDPPVEGPWKHIWSHLYLAAFVVMAAPAIGAQISSFCLTDDRITLRDTPWTPAKVYGWTAISEIDSGCRKTEKGGFTHYYGLVMSDGRVVDIAGSIPDFEPGYDRMRQAIAKTGQRPPLFSQNVHSDCGYDNIRLLTEQL
jgi:hypothetical protein